MTRVWTGLALLVAASGGILAADDEQVKWVKLEEAAAKSATDGKPLVVFCATDLIVDGPPVKGLDRAFASEAVRPFRDDFYFVKCTDMKTVKAVKAVSKCELIFLDPDGVEIHRCVVTGSAQIASALKEALTKYANKTIPWNADAPPKSGAFEGKPMIVLLFADESSDVASAIASLEDRRIVKFHEKCVFVKIAYRKESPQTREWNIQRAPTLLLLDTTKDFAPKSVLERSSERKNPREMKTFLMKGLSSIERTRR